jgi:SAM-dependent methyltransferase
VPLWNAGHRVSWLIGDYLGALGRRSLERCDVCGRLALMLYRRRVVPPRLEELWGLSPRLAKALARKESSHCSRCGAQLRSRRLARVVVDLVGKAPRGQSLAAWVSDPANRALRIAEINRIEGVHDQIVGMPNLAYSDFVPGAAPGEFVRGVRSEDLTRLTYPDASFDLVLSSESLEHVPDLHAALREIWRVLVPGGWHIFTLPLLPGVPKTFARARVREDGTIEHQATPIRHPGGDVGYPVFTEFGADLPEILQAEGFVTDVRFGPTTEDDLAQVYVCRKPFCNNDQRDGGVSSTVAGDPAGTGPENRLETRSTSS